MLGGIFVVLIDGEHFSDLLVNLIIGDINLKLIGKLLNNNRTLNATSGGLLDLFFPLFLSLLAGGEKIFHLLATGLKVAREVFLDVIGLLFN